MNKNIVLAALLSVAIAPAYAETNVFGRIGNGVADFGKGAWNRTQNAADAVWNASPKKVVNGTWDMTKNAGTTAFDFTKNTASTAWDVTKNATNRSVTFVTQDAPEYARNNPWKTTGFVVGGVAATAGIYWVGGKIANWWNGEAA